MLLIRSGSVETNPGPTPVNNTCNKLSFATWNIDSILARNNAKLPLIESLVETYRFDLFGICETYLTGSIPNEKLILNGYSSAPLRSDCKDIGKRPKGGVCLYYNENLPLTHRRDMEILDESIVKIDKTQKEKNIFCSHL